MRAFPSLFDEHLSVGVEGWLQRDHCWRRMVMAAVLMLCLGLIPAIVVMENNDWRSYPYTKDLRRVSAEDVAFLSATGTQRARYLLLRADSVALVPFDIPPYPEVP